MNQNRIESIQGLRAVAVILVVAYHANDLFARGFIGVDIFFVISGFVITGLIKRSVYTNGKLNVLEFWRRRFLRIVPGLAVMLAGVTAVSLLLESWHLEQRRTQVSALAALFSFSNWKFSTDDIGYFSLDSSTNPLLHTWSLGVEEQFYIVFPVFAVIATLVAKRKTFAKTIVLVSALMLICGSLALQLHYSGNSQSTISRNDNLNNFLSNVGSPFYGTPSRIWQFLFGAVSQLTISQFRKVPLIVHKNIQKFAPWILILAAVSGDASISRRLVIFYMFIVALTALALISLNICSEEGQKQSVLQNRVMIWIGDRSYSWYLWHMPLIVFSQKILPNETLGGIVGAFISLLFAALSFRYVESKFRDHWNIKNTKRAKPLAVIVLAPALVFCLGFYIVTPRLERDAGTANPVFTGCNPYSSPCVRNEGSNKTNVLLLEGDSHAASISEVVSQIATRYRLKLIICLRDCATQNDLNSLIINEKVSTIISMRQYPSVPSAGYELVESIARERPNLNVLLIADNPQFEEWKPPALIGPKTPPIRLTEVKANQFGALTRLQKIDAELENVRVIQVLDLLCGELMCKADLDGRLMYSDDNHLSAFGANLLLSRLESFLILNQ